MAYTQEDFQEWIFFISDKLDYMTDTFAKENGLNLDFSVESIDALEEWMLAHYSSPQDLINDPRMHDLLTVYIGETYRQHLGGKWFIDLENKKNAYYAMPILKDRWINDTPHRCHSISQSAHRDVYEHNLPLQDRAFQRR